MLRQLGWPCLAPLPCEPPPSETHRGRRSENWATGTSGLHNPTLFQAAGVPPPPALCYCVSINTWWYFYENSNYTVIIWILHWVACRFTKNVLYIHISPPHQPPRNKTIPLCKYGDLYHLYLGAIVPRSSPTTPYTATEGVFRVRGVLQKSTGNCTSILLKFYR